MRRNVAVTIRTNMVDRHIAEQQVGRPRLRCITYIKQHGPVICQEVAELQRRSGPRPSKWQSET